MNFDLHFGELHSDNSINDKNNLFENYIPKCYKVKRILISFNCFSEYTIYTMDNTSKFSNSSCFASFLCAYVCSADQFKLQ